MSADPPTSPRPPKRDTRKRVRPKRSGGRGPKPNEARLQRVEQLICAQASSSAIVRLITEEFGCKARAVYYDMAEAWKRLEKEAEEERPRRKAQVRASLRYVLQMAISKKDRKDLKSAVAALRELAKIDGLYDESNARVNVHLGGSVDVRSQKLVDALRLTPIERARRIAVLQGTPVGSGHKSVEQPEVEADAVDDDDDDDDDAVDEDDADDGDAPGDLQ